MDRRGMLKGIVAAAGCAGALGCRKAMASTNKKVAPTDAVGMLYDSTRCIGCKACVVACRDVNGLPPATTEETGGLYDMQTELDANTKTAIKLYQEVAPETGQQTNAFVKAQCMHCVDPACVSVCMLGALSKREFGVVSWNGDLCVGCRYCQLACPFGVPKFEFNKAAPKIVKCEMCLPRLKEGKQPACTEVCPREAVIFGKLEDLKREAHARLEKEPTRYIQKVYGEHDVGGTQVLYLSGVSFEKLGLPNLGNDPVPAMSEKVTHGIMQGLATPAVLYAALGAVIWRNHRTSHDGSPPPSDGAPPASGDAGEVKR